MTKSKQGW